MSGALFRDPREVKRIVETIEPATEKEVRDKIKKLETVRKIRFVLRAVSMATDMASKLLMSYVQDGMPIAEDPEDAVFRIEKERLEKALKTGKAQGESQEKPEEPTRPVTEVPTAQRPKDSSSRRY